jgi:hypothetical protein
MNPDAMLVGYGALPFREQGAAVSLLGFFRFSKVI